MPGSQAFGIAGNLEALETLMREIFRKKAAVGGAEVLTYSSYWPDARMKEN